MSRLIDLDQMELIARTIIANDQCDESVGLAQLILELVQENRELRGEIDASAYKDCAACRGNTFR
jgi:hypothetical protein